jgi:hypothetical protein
MNVCRLATRIDATGRERGEMQVPMMASDATDELNPS